MEPLHLEDGDDAFIAEVEERSGQKVRRCYQCGGCTGRCPAAFAHDLPVNRIMRLIQLGRRHEVLGCAAIWTCAACRACAVQCPNGIDVTQVMETCRRMADEAGQVRDRAAKIFSEQFLSSVRRYGRVFEPGLMMGFMLRTGRLLADVDLAPAMLLKRKLPVRPEKGGHGEVEGIFARYDAARAAKSGGRAQEKARKKDAGRQA